MSAPALLLRLATADDAPAIRALIVDSVRALSVGYLTPEQVNAELTYVISLDTTLIEDGTYYVVVAPDGTLAGAGGWSRRRAMHGGEEYKALHGLDEAEAFVDPRTEPARIRMMFTHPDWARRGIARRILDVSTAAAETEGFSRLVLTATMAGVPLYTAMGFSLDRKYTDELPNGALIPVAEMSRDI